MPETSQPMIKSDQSQFRRVMMLVGIGYLFFSFSYPREGIMGLVMMVIPISPKCSMSAQPRWDVSMFNI